MNAKVESLLKQMTLDEKLSMLSGTGFATRPIPRLGIPAMEMVDGPQGVRGGSGTTQGPATAFPCGVCIAATWNPVLVEKVGEAIGRETISKGSGADVILGPCLNIHRTPLGGRNCESYGEDPYLAARTAVAYINGVQSQGAAACAKHYACNNQETQRNSVDVIVDERTLQEIYLPAFRAAAQEAHVWSFMAAYNKINGPHATAQNHLINEILKKDWGWDGLMMSDWGAVHDVAPVLNAGNDLEMPGGDWLVPAKLKAALEQKQIAEATVDEAVRRIVRCVVRTGLMDGKKKRTPADVNSAEHRKLARQVATEGMVLLKDDRSVLPLNRSIKRVAVFSPNATVARTSVGGSGHVTPKDPVTPMDGLKSHLPTGARVDYISVYDPTGDTSGIPAIPADCLTTGVQGQQGLKAEYFASKDLSGEPVLSRVDKNIDFNWGTASPGDKVPNDSFSVRWTGSITPKESGTYTMLLSSDDGSRLYIDGKLLIDSWADQPLTTRTAAIGLQAGKTYPLKVEYYETWGEATVKLGWMLQKNDPVAQAAREAADADVAIVFGGVWDKYEGEGFDRASMRLPGNQDALIKAVSAANKNTVVVLFGGTPSVMTDWIGSVPAVLQAWYPGVECGNAIADVLFGNVNPSGKLPDTFAHKREDYPDFANFPGTGGKVDYAEGIFVGYRHFDRKGIQPLFPFGHGLSYTSFGYSDLKLSSSKMRRGKTVTASVTITNTGKLEGAETVQMYVGEVRPSLPRPVRELKGFKKVYLKPGEKTTVKFEVGEQAFSFFDTAKNAWRANSGEYEISIGSSSRDLKGKLRLTLE